MNLISAPPCPIGPPVISGPPPWPVDSSAVLVGAGDSPATIKNKIPQKTKFFL